MAKDAVTDWSTTAGNNTDVGGISLAENVMRPPAVNDAFREVMEQIAVWAANPVLAVSDGGALGSATKMWSDLFLASGGVINWNNGNVTITHAAGTLTIAGGDIVLSDKILQRPVLKDYGETVNAIGGTGGGTQDIDLTLGNVVTATVDTSANTFTFSNPSASGTACSFTLILTNGGSQTVNWPASVDWASGVAPTLTAAGRDVLSFLTVDGGTIWYGFVGGLAFA
jgi:hypothetical protein